MSLQIVKVHPAKSPDTLNDEWFIVENAGQNDFVSKGCVLTVGKSSQPRGRPVGTIDPGFVLHPGEKVRLITGSPGKKAHGKPPEEDKDVKNYHLFLGGSVLTGAGTVLRLVLNQVEMVKVVFDPNEKDGIAKAE
jgi:hypothetical protein